MLLGLIMSKILELSVRTDKNEYVKACFYGYLFMKRRGLDVGFLLNEVMIYADQCDDVFIKAYVNKADFKGSDLVGLVKEMALKGVNLVNWSKFMCKWRKANDEERGWALVWMKALNVKGLMFDVDKEITELLQRGTVSNELMFVFTNNSAWLENVAHFTKDYRLWLVMENVK